MFKFLIFLTVFFFVATPLLAFLNLHDDCSEQICHILMTNLFVLTPALVVLMMFLMMQLIIQVFSFKIFYCLKISPPPRPVRS